MVVSRPGCPRACGRTAQRALIARVAKALALDAARVQLWRTPPGEADDDAAPLDLRRSPLELGLVTSGENQTPASASQGIQPTVYSARCSSAASGCCGSGGCCSFDRGLDRPLSH